MSDGFKAAWTKFHPKSWPLARSLPDYDGENLVRFHLLPEGRPHVLNRDELKALIGRFNTLGEAVFGEGHGVWLVYAQWSKPDIQPDFKTRNRTLRFRVRWQLKSDWDFFSPADKQTYTVYAGRVTWRKNAFDRLFLDLYNLRMADVLLMRDDGAIFRPWAIGADVTMPTPQMMMALVEDFYGWLPVHGRGILKFNKAQMSGNAGKFSVSKACAEAINKALKAPEER